MLKGWNSYERGVRAVARSFCKPALFLVWLLLLLPPAFADSITKNEAKSMFGERINSDVEFRSNPVKKEFSICMFDQVLEETFGSATVLEQATFERRFSSATDRFKSAIDRENSDTMLSMKKCLVNSDSLKQAVKEDGNQSNSSSVTKPYPTLSLLDMDDLRVDMGSLGGRKVRVRGIGHYVMDIFMLKKNVTDMSPIVIDISKLRREQRRQLIQQCNDIMSGCRVTVQGTVGKVSYQNGIFAENIEW